jgi:hypothetical protein
MPDNKVFQHFEGFAAKNDRDSAISDDLFPNSHVAAQHRFRLRCLVKFASLNKLLNIEWLRSGSMFGPLGGVFRVLETVIRTGFANGRKA